MLGAFPPFLTCLLKSEPSEVGCRLWLTPLPSCIFSSSWTPRQERERRPRKAGRLPSAQHHSPQSPLLINVVSGKGHRLRSESNLTLLAGGLEFPETVPGLPAMCGEGGRRMQWDWASL